MKPQRRMPRMHAGGGWRHHGAHTCGAARLCACEITLRRPVTARRRSVLVDCGRALVGSCKGWGGGLRKRLGVRLFALYNIQTTHGARCNAKIHSHMTVTILTRPLHAFSILRTYEHHTEADTMATEMRRRGRPSPQHGRGCPPGRGRPGGSRLGAPGGRWRHAHAATPAATSREGPGGSR